MIRASGEHKTGERYFILGITEDELCLMKEGVPVEVNGHEIGLPGKLIVFYGKTEADMLREFASAGIELPDDASTRSP